MSEISFNLGGICTAEKNRQLEDATSEARVASKIDNTYIGYIPHSAAFLVSV